ncbi:MAG: hypothetical protein ACLUPF_11995 [Dorea sp.]
MLYIREALKPCLRLAWKDRLVATAGLDNEVPDELKDAFSKTNYLDEFTPSLETVTMLEPEHDAYPGASCFLIKISKCNRLDRQRLQHLLQHKHTP